MFLLDGSRGEPGGEFLQKSQAALLLEKQSKLDSEWRARKAAAQRQKEMQEMRRKADEQRKRRFERKEEEELKEEMNEEEVKMEDVKEDEPLGEPLRAELTEEEKRMWRPKALSDLAPMTLSHLFSTRLDQYQYELNRNSISFNIHSIKSMFFGFISNKNELRMSLT